MGHGLGLCAGVCVCVLMQRSWKPPAGGAKTNLNVKLGTMALYNKDAAVGFPWLYRIPPPPPVDSIRGAQSALTEKLEVKMTKAFCKLQGLVFTILSSGSAFSPAARWMLSGLFLFYFSSEKR